jgi:4-hydroxybenzoate polyprenyltransferase
MNGSAAGAVAVTAAVAPTTAFAGVGGSIDSAHPVASAVNETIDTNEDATRLEVTRMVATVCHSARVGGSRIVRYSARRMTAVAARSSGSGSSFRVFASVSRLHIIAIAALGTFTFGWLFTGVYPWALSAVCALDWFLVNLLNRVVDLPEDRANQITGTDFVARHASTVRTFGFVTLLASFVAIHFAIPAITPYRVVFHALGLAYNWPLLPGRARIKQLYFWKNTASATGFMLTCFAYPLAVAHRDGATLANGITTATILVTALFFFLFELSYEVIYDLRDALGDAEANVRTYPVVHGERGAVRIIDALCIASASVLLVGFATHVVPWRIAVMVVAPLVQVVVYRRWLRRGITSADCIGLTWFGAALLVAYHLWVVLRLPGVGMD